MSLKIPNHDDEIPGKPKKAEQLFIPPRSSRRRSSAILNCSAAAAVKAVSLLRRKSDTDNDNSLSVSFPAKRSSSFQDPARITVVETMKPRSAPARKSRYRFRDKSKSPTINRRAKGVKVDLTKDASKRQRRSVSVSAMATDQGSARTKLRIEKIVDSSGTPGNERSEIKPLNRDKKTRIRKGDFKQNVISKSTQGPPREATINVESKANSPGFLPTVALEKSVVQKPNVVIKEIINRGIPGRRFSPKSYRRFDKSIFDVLDKPVNQEPSSSVEETLPAKSPVLNPWSVSFAASKWMTNVLQRRQSERALELSDDNGQPPIIVIEDWSPESGSKGSEEVTDSFQLGPSRKTPTRKTNRTPTPVLDDVTEESEEEIQKYEDEPLPSERYRGRSFTGYCIICYREPL